MHSSTNLPYTGISSFFFATTSYSKSLGFNTSYRKIHINSTNTRNTTCKAASSSSSWITEFDLYDLLGIDSSSDQSQIKSAYRALQKRCHPDIAGPTGHDMAIILNQAYSVLSDPNSRFVYDKEQSKISELRGYTGKPLYSVWYGSDSENRAVFVDEVKCIGCLKCALLAEKTFAIESVYGRARVVSQWADSESKIQEAIDACPVDCISMVERSNLAALEFLMSKQPRGNVRVGASNAVGARVSNIFVDVKKFQTRFQDSTDKKASSTQSTEPEEMNARSVAIQTIRSISNWLYWRQPNSNSDINTSLTITGRKIYSEPKNINKLREAVAARKRDMENGIRIPSSKDIRKEEYWVPSALVLPQSKGGFTNSEEDVAQRVTYTEENNTATTNKDVEYYEVKKQRKKRNFPGQGFIPLVAATIAGTMVHQQIEQGSTVTRLEEHIGGSMALGIVNSSWSQVILAGLTWYLISMYVIELVQAFISKVGVDKN